MRFPRLLLAALLALPPLCLAAGPELPGLELAGMEKLLEECRARSLDLEALIIREKERVGGFEALSEEEAALLETFLACRGVASGRREGCEVLKGLKGNLEDSYRSCRERQAQALWLWSVWRQGDSVSACLEALAGPGGPLKPQDLERFCRVSPPLIRQGSPQALCRELAASKALPGQAAQECLPGFAFLEGQEKCQGLQGIGLRHACRELALLVAALSAGRSCPSPLCAVLLNRGQDCSSYLSQASQSFCARLAREVEPLRARREGQREREIGLRKEVESARQREAELKVRIRAEREREKKQFKKGQPMEQVPPEVLDQMKRLLLQGPKEGGEGPAEGSSTDGRRLP